MEQVKLYDTTLRDGMGGHGMSLSVGEKLKVRALDGLGVHFIEAGFPLQPEGSGALRYVMRNAVVGRHVYAIGGNLPAAKLSGVRDKKVTFLVFLNMGMLAALAGLIFAARFNAASPKAGTNFELEAIAAAFIGGASMSGGVGTVLGAIIGGLVLGVLNNGMNLVGVGTDWQQVIKGLVLLAAVGFDVWNKRKVGS